MTDTGLPDCLRIAGRRVHVEHVNPPIPLREFDFCAVFRDYEPGDPQGYGATVLAAVQDLRDKVAPNDNRELSTP